MTSKLPYYKQKLFEGMSLAGKQQGYQLAKGFDLIGIWTGLKILKKNNICIIKYTEKWNKRKSYPQ